MTKVIEIVVIGGTGSGKSHVLDLIDRALRSEYGHHVQIASHDLSCERGLGSPGAKPRVSDTIFNLKEQGIPSATQSLSSLKIEVDTSSIDSAVSKVEALHGFTTGCAIEPLESAIESTARLMRDELERMAEISLPLSGKIPSSTLYSRLGAHMEQLLAEQLRRVQAHE